MSIKMIMFDLDGTLLPMENEELFVEKYFGLLAAKLKPHGYDPKQLISAVWAGTSAMSRNTGEASNEEVFWEKFSGVYGKGAVNDKPLFEEFYQNEFQQVKAVCGYNETAVQTVRKLREMGLRVMIATKPLFPSIAVESRIRWAGFEPEEFESYMTYESCHYCKPDPKYYSEILEKVDAKPEECLMVGNDADEDMIAETTGMKVFLLTDCLLNRSGKDISGYPQGGFEELLRFVEEM